MKEHKGVVSGMLHAMLLKTYADLAKELGVAPGGEFRRAYHEVRIISLEKVLFESMQSFL